MTENEIKDCVEEAFVDSEGEPLSTIEYRAIRVADERGILKFGEADELYKAVRAEFERVQAERDHARAAELIEEERLDLADLWIYAEEGAAASSDPEVAFNHAMGAYVRENGYVRENSYCVPREVGEYLKKEVAAIIQGSNFQEED